MTLLSQQAPLSSDSWQRRHSGQPQWLANRPDWPGPSVSDSRRSFMFFTVKNSLLIHVVPVFSQAECPVPVTCPTPYFFVKPSVSTARRSSSDYCSGDCKRKNRGLSRQRSNSSYCWAWQWSNRVTDFQVMAAMDSYWCGVHVIGAIRWPSMAQWAPLTSGGKAKSKFVQCQPKCHRTAGTYKSEEAGVILWSSHTLPSLVFMTFLRLQWILWALMEMIKITKSPRSPLAFTPRKELSSRCKQFSTYWRSCCNFDLATSLINPFSLSLSLSVSQSLSVCLSLSLSLSFSLSVSLTLSTPSLLVSLSSSLRSFCLFSSLCF